LPRAPVPRAAWYARAAAWCWARVLKYMGAPR
jgi:hypothetical protein